MADATTSRNRVAAPADTYPGPTVAEMGEFWQRSLRARNARPETQRTYLTAVTQFDAFLRERGMPTEVGKITREHVEAFIEHLLATKSASTAKTRFGGLKTFFRYVCEDEGEVERSPMERMRAPTVEDAETPIPDLEDLRRLLKACSGKSFDDRRDAALFKLLGDTGMRRGELAALTMDDVDLNAQAVTVHALSSKSRRSRVVPFGPDTANALGRYVRMRERHPKAATSRDAFWIGKLGPLTGAGILQILHRRCKEAGVPRMHPHQLRHFFADAALAAGMSELDVQRLGGWRNAAMLRRYGAAHAEKRAVAAYRSMPSPMDRL